MIILIALALGVLAHEIAYAELSLWVKKLLYLDKYYPAVELLSSIKPYKKLFNKYLYPLLPIVLIIMILAATHRFMYKLLSCPFCISVWLGLIVGLIGGYTLPIILILPFLTSFMCAVYSKLRG